MGGASIGNAVENKILDHIVANATYSAPTVYLALWTSTLDDTSTAATAGELAYTTYARQSISSTNMSPAAAGSVTNDVAITFPAVSAGGGTVTFWMLASSVSGAGDNICLGHRNIHRDLHDPDPPDHRYRRARRHARLNGGSCIMQVCHPSGSP